MDMDTAALGSAMKASLDAQLEMFPLMWNDEAQSVVNQFPTEVMGYKISGAGGGGYIVAVSDKPIENATQIKIRFTR